MKPFKMFLKEKSVDDQKEILSAFLMNDLLHGKSHTPYSSSSLKIHSLLTIINDIIINKRKNLLEFGAGISTLIMAVQSTSMSWTPSYIQSKTMPPGFKL